MQDCTRLEVTEQFHRSKSSPEAARAQERESGFDCSASCQPSACLSKDQAPFTSIMLLFTPPHHHSSSALRTPFTEHGPRRSASVEIRARFSVCPPASHSCAFLTCRPSALPITQSNDRSSFVLCLHSLSPPDSRRRSERCCRLRLPTGAAVSILT